MTRRALTITAAAWAVAGCPVFAQAQPRRRIPHVGVLSLGESVVQEDRYGRAFRDALRELGWIEERNYTLDLRFADGRPARLQALAAELLDLKVDVIFALGPPAAIAARKATATVPIVFAGVPDPVALGLVQSLARPGGNATGVTFAVGPEFTAEQLELLREVAPRAARVAFLYNGANPAAPLYAAALEAPARRLRIEVERFGARNGADLGSIFKRITEWRADALLLVGDSLTLAHRAQIIDFASRHRLPAVYGHRQFAEDGGLIAYSWNEAEVLRRLAALVDKILKGTPPADLPVEQPNTFELVVNAATAKRLSIVLPPAVLLRADHVIQ